MPGKIFINYRRDDARDVAARIRDRLASMFGTANVFMDVDNLMAGQRFDKELEKALADTDVFLSVIGPKWMDLLAERQLSGERDYVREEIAGALKRGITVIPVLIEQTPLPRADALPDEIRELVLHQKHGITYEQFGRDVTGLADAIRFARQPKRAQVLPSVPWGWVGATAVSVIAVGWVGAYQLGAPVWAPWTSPPQPIVLTPTKEQLDAAARQSVQKEQEAKRQADQMAADEAKARQVAAKKAEDERKRAADALAKKAADDAERKRIAAIAEETNRRIAEANAKLDAEEKEAAAKKSQATTVKPGQTFRDCADVCPEMVVVPAGEFMMGSNDYDDEKPPHKVTIARPFAVGKFEVTFAEWEGCVASGGCSSNRNPSDQGWGRGRRPAINVSWNDAKEYTAWLSRKTGKTYRLLSEAEWEFAARGGTTTVYPWGDKFENSKANNNAKQTVPVGQYAANQFGLHDMHGNVWEWCEDTRHSNYQGAPNDGSAWTSGGTSSRVLRGGSWNNDPNDLRSAGRGISRPDVRGSGIGFRVARTL